jgi:hypothetical protein
MHKTSAMFRAIELELLRLLYRIYVKSQILLISQETSISSISTPSLARFYDAPYS